MAVTPDTSAYVPPQQDPQFAGCSVSSFCALGPRPLLMTGLLRHLLIQHFGDANNIEHPELRDNVWSAVDTNKGILIESITRWFPNQTEKVPAVVLKRNTYQQVKLGINNQWLGAGCDGQQKHSVLWQGSHTLFCIAGGGAEAELLGSEVQRELTQFGPIIRRSLNLIRFDIVEIGPIYILEEAKQNSMVPVTVGVAYGENWVLTPGKYNLQRLTLQELMTI